MGKGDSEEDVCVAEQKIPLNDPGIVEYPGNVETSYSRPPIVPGHSSGPKPSSVGVMEVLMDHMDPPSTEYKLLSRGQAESRGRI